MLDNLFERDRTSISTGQPPDEKHRLMDRFNGMVDLDEDSSPGDRVRHRTEYAKRTDDPRSAGEQTREQTNRDSFSDALEFD